jgi:hypothetical protein
MKYRKILFGLILATSVTTAAAYAQNLTPSPTPSSTSSPTPSAAQSPKPSSNKTWEINVDTILKSPNLADTKFWLMLGAILASGSLGGLVFELLNLQGNIELPHRPTNDGLAAKFAYAQAKDVVDLGVVARLLIGALAAPPAIAVIRPETAFVLLATSAVAGSAGTLIFRALQDRLLAAVLQTGKGEVGTRTITQKDKLDEAMQAFEKLDEKLRNQSKSEKGLVELEFMKDASLDPKDFSQVSLLLNEAKGVNAKVDEAIKTFKELEQEVRRQANSRTGTTKLEIPKGTRLKSEHLDKVKTQLIEAKGVAETTTPAEASTNAQPVSEITTIAGDSNTSQSESNNKQNGVVEERSLVR